MPRSTYTRLDQADWPAKISNLKSRVTYLNYSTTSRHLTFRTHISCWRIIISVLTPTHIFWRMVISSGHHVELALMPWYAQSSCHGAFASIYWASSNEHCEKHCKALYTGSILGSLHLLLWKALLGSPYSRVKQRNWQISSEIQTATERIYILDV